MIEIVIIKVPHNHITKGLNRHGYYSTKKEVLFLKRPAAANNVVPVPGE